ncbi:MAG: hypothetical protein HYU66_10965 [Armatimonadetes bacterium]|nr:hypothetical protein [Armatimonadota bacterium]
MVILPGTYRMAAFDDDIITPRVDGRTDAWITIRGSDPANRPVLTGRGSLLAAVLLGGRHYVRVEDLEMTSELDQPYTGGLRQGVDAGGSDDPTLHTGFITLRHLAIHHVEETPINLGGNSNDVNLEDLDLHHTGASAVAAPAGVGGAGWERVALRRSHIYRIGWFSQGLEQTTQDVDDSRPDGIGMEPSAGPLEVDHCVFEHCRGDGLDSKTRQTYVHETVIANVRCDGLKMWYGLTRVQNVLIYGAGDTDPNNGPWASIVFDGQEPGRYELTNVTVDDRVERNNYPVYAQYANPVTATIALRNCLFAHGSTTFFFDDSVTLEADHTLFYRNGQADEPVVHANGRDYLPAELGALGTGVAAAEPQFVQRAWGGDGDYHLLPGSPGINTGNATGAPTVDLDGQARPAGAAVDLGAYER